MWRWELAIGLAVIIIVYMVTYTLVRTSGDGRSAWHRLVHPGKGGLQEEYGGLGPEVENPELDTHVAEDAHTQAEKSQTGIGGS